VEQRGALGEGQQEGVEAVASSGATCGGQERQGASSGVARRPAVALLRGRGGAEEEEEGGGGQGLRCKLQKLQGPHCNTKFPTILKLK
jgi:hypothetical protein